MIRSGHLESFCFASDPCYIVQLCGTSDPTILRATTPSALLRQALTPSLTEMTGAGTKARTMQRVIEMTLAYMEGAETCKPEERVTLYRGFGRQPIYRPKGSQDPGFMLNNVWFEANITDILALQSTVGFTKRTVTLAADGGLPSLSGDDIGNVMFDNSKLLTNFNPQAFSWKDLLFKYDWDQLSVNHSQGEGDPDVLISTTLLSEVARRFGPGYLTLSVCPERTAFVTKTSENFGELEVYLPLFILPEEIVSIDGLECGQLPGDDDGEAAQECFKKATGTPFVHHPASLSSPTLLYRQCFMNFGTLAETSESDLLTTRYSKNLKAFYKILAASNSSRDFRSKLVSELQAQCKPDCALGKKIMKRLKADLAANVELSWTSEELAPSLAELQSFVASTCQ